ncbi:MAG: hypothetical protein FWG90_11440 [Oscillospiraceae bacterium]|nr:hypothetical protein [Oscillospiraceae bacterium]
MGGIQASKGMSPAEMSVNFQMGLMNKIKDSSKEQASSILNMANNVPKFAGDIGSIFDRRA